MRGRSVSNDGRWSGSGAIARFTPVWVGFIYGRISVESFLDVAPRGFMTLTKRGWGMVGLWCG